MSRNEEGEFELVLGNRQLVSVFLIVVILLGAFFSMGYLVGRSSSPSTTAENGVKPIVVDTAKSNPPAPVESTPNPPMTAATPTSPPPVQVVKPSPLQSEDEKRREAKKEDTAKREEAKREEARREEAKREEARKKDEARKDLTKKTDAKKEEPKRDERKNAPGPPPASDEPRGGTFLQVVATSRPDAEIVAESLAKKGFKTTIAPGPTGAIYRVLVGPVGDAADLAETRVRLETAGFKPYVRKY